MANIALITNNILTDSGTPLTSIPSGSGTTNYLSKWTGTTALGNSLMYDNGTTLLVGTTTASTDYSSALLALSKSNNYTYQEIRGSGQATLVLTQGVTANSTTPAVEIFNAYNFGIKYIGGTGGAFSNYPFYYYAGNAAGSGDYIMMQTAGLERLRIVNNGNLLIGTTTDAGYKLDVAGTGRIQGQLEVLSVNSTNGILLKHTALSTTATQIYYNSSDAVTYLDTLFSYTASQPFGSVNIRTKDSLNALTSRLYVEGNSGNVGIGTTAFLGKFQVGSGSATQFQVASSGASIYVGPSSGNYNMNITTNTIQSSNSGNTNTYLYIQPNGTGNVAMCSSGTNKVLIGTTTDAGYKLDVNGTARVITSLQVGNFTPGVAAASSTIFTTGRISASGGITFYNPAAGDNQETGFKAGGYGVQIYINNGTVGSFGGYGSSTDPMLNLTSGFNPSSGSTNKTILLLNSTYQVSGTYSGGITGFLYNPSLTSITGIAYHRAIHTVTGDVIFNSTSGSVGIGTTSPAYKLQVAGDIGFTAGANRYIRMANPSSSGSANHIVIQAASANTSGTGGNIYLYEGSGAGGPGAGSIYIGATTGWTTAYVTGRLTVTNSGPNTETAFQVNAGGQNGLTINWDNVTPYMGYGLVVNRQSRFYNSSSYTFDNNLIIGSNTNAGYKLDVSGTARVQGVITGSVSGGSLSLGAASSNSQAITITGYFTGNGAISTANSNGRSFNTNIGGQGYGFVTSYNGLAQGQTTTNTYFSATGNINLTDGAIDLNGFNFNPTIVSETGATIKAFSSGLNSASNHWNLYLNGTAKNHIAGNLLVGTTTDNGYKLQVAGNTYVSGVTATSSLNVQNAADVNSNEGSNDLLVYADLTSGVDVLYGGGKVKANIYTTPVTTPKTINPSSTVAFMKWYPTTSQGVFIDYVLYIGSGTEMRSGTVTIVNDTSGNAQLLDTKTADLNGSTANITFAVVNNGGTMEFQVTNSGAVPAYMNILTRYIPTIF